LLQLKTQPKAFDTNASTTALFSTRHDEIISASFLQSRRLVGIIAGGANHRFSKKMRQAPDGAAEGFAFFSVFIF
jgi:hypothetical protein